jgi:hypothetical protein
MKQKLLRLQRAQITAEDIKEIEDNEKIEDIEEIEDKDTMSSDNFILNNFIQHFSFTTKNYTSI